jgi:SNF2 family DNA or RNA helicase
MNLRTTSQLLPHQKEAVAKLSGTRIGALFMEMGTGKTRTTIELVSLRQERIDRCVWFCPVSLKTTIAAEIRKHTNAVDSDIHVFDHRTSKRDMPDAQWYVIGIESMSKSMRIIFAASALITEKTFVVVDESSYIKGYSSLRTRRLTALAEQAQYRLILTGTPISQGVVDLFAQMRFLSPKILGYRSFFSFAANHLEYSKKYPGMIVRSHNLDYLAAKIKPYVYQVTKKECLTLPPKLHESYYFDMTGRQTEAYDRAKCELLMDIPDEEVTSWVIFKLFSALQSITCGFWNRRTPEGIVEERYPHGRIKLLMDVVNRIPKDEKVIVWAKYHYDIEGIVLDLENRWGPGSCAVYTGKKSERERVEEISKFRNDARFFVATPSAGGHGLTLNEAHHVVFYNNGFKFSERLQAEDRCHRIGQGCPVTYVDILCSGSIDERIKEALDAKENVVDRFKRELDMVKRSGIRKRLLEIL